MHVPNPEMERVDNLQTWEEVQTILSSPVPVVEVTQSTGSMPPATKVVDLK